jgi:aspartyl-tRNA(Asn)/glutamyl-tRNA(Gln) amidotransferase subunit B
LPTLNAEAVAMAVKAALALGGEVQPQSRFARKNYFYPDLPKGYQISQFDEPFCLGGALEITLPPARGESHSRVKVARLTRIHMEEDAGKNLHDVFGSSVVDLNRAGVPLIEIVGEPDLRSAEEAAEYLRTLREELVFLGINDGNLEEGSLRCDANVSIRPAGESKLGTRVELKNINSFRFVEKAIGSEIERQKDVLETGGRVVAETRGWDENTNSTYSLRSKETAQDYRYFPEPDLPPLMLDQAFVERMRAELGESPRQKRVRFIEELGLTAQAAAVLSQHPRTSAFFEEAVMLFGEPRKIANFIQSEVLRDVTTQGLKAKIPLSAQQLASILGLVQSGKISGKQAKELYAKIKFTVHDPVAMALELGMSQVTDPKAIEEVCAKVMADNPKQLTDLKAGKTQLLGFFVGQVMKATKGSANPELVNATLARLLGTAQVTK